MGMKPKSLMSHLKGKSIAKEAKTPKIAPDAPMVGMAGVVVRYVWNRPAITPKARYSTRKRALPIFRSTESPLTSRKNMFIARWMMSAWRNMDVIRDKGFSPLMICSGIRP